eukprot:jgi/Psemu1/2477/gm1.2477_g
MPDLKMSRPMYNIEQTDIDERDVIFGKGAHGNHHAGNKDWKKTVNSRSDRYNSCTKNKEKYNICFEIVKERRSNGGRFLQKNPETAKWYEIGDKKAIRKTGQRFRDQLNTDKKSARISLPNKRHESESESESDWEKRSRTSPSSDGSSGDELEEIDLFMEQILPLVNSSTPECDNHLEPVPLWESNFPPFCLSRGSSFFNTHFVSPLISMDFGDDGFTPLPLNQSLAKQDLHNRIRTITITIAIAIKLKSTSATMDIPNNNVDSDADSNEAFSPEGPPPMDTSVKKKTLNLESALFSHQKNNTDFSSSSSKNDNNDDDNIKIPPNDKAPPTKKAPNKKAPPNPHQEAMKALLMKKSPYMRAIKTIFLVKFKGLSLSNLHQNKLSSALIKLLTKAIDSGSTVSQRQQNWNTKFMVPILVTIHFRCKVYKEELAAFCATFQTSSRNNHSTSTFQTQTIKYLDPIKKEFNVATNQYIEQMKAKKAKSTASSKGDRPQDFIEYDITKGDTFPCPK